MKYTIDEILRQEFLTEIRLAAMNPFYQGPEVEAVRALIPDNQAAIWQDVVKSTLEDAEKMSDCEFEKLINQIPTGYLKFRLLERRRGHDGR